MKRRILVYAICLLCCVVTGREALSQGTMEFRNSGNDSVKTVLILHDTVYRFRQKDSVTDIITMLGNVKLQEDRTIIYCDSMVRNSRDNFIEAFGHVQIFDGDSTNIYSDYMKYQAVAKTVLFQKNVKLTDGKGVLTTQELQYDLNTKIGVYSHGGKVVNNGSILTSEQATYYEESKDVLFKKNVVLRDPQYDLSADSLLYNTQTQVSTFIAETFILFKDSTRRTVLTRDGFYDLKNRKAQFGKRPVMTDGSQRLTGDSVLIDDSLGISLAIGHAVYVDTAENLSIRAGYMINDKKMNTFLATQKPLMATKQDKDSIYITADTLFSGRLIDQEAADRIMAIQDSLHRIYVDSLDRVSADSMHRVFLDRQRRSGVDSLKSGIDTVNSIGTDSGNHVVVKDKSHEQGTDSAATAAAAVAAAALVPSHSPADRIRTISPIAPSSTIVNRNGKPTVPIPQLSRPIPQAPSRPDSSKAAFGRPRLTTPRRKAANQYTDDGRTLSGREAIPLDTAAAKPTDSTVRYIKGYHHVKIFSDSLQAVSDSLFYSGKDSIFRLFREPIAWGNGNYQITGDTMFVFTKNKKADRLYVFENGLAINKIGPNFYNQIKGTTINGFFKDGQIDFMRAKGNAESIYYVKDDVKGFTGVNKAHADIIDMIFQEKELNRVVLRNDAEGSMIPFRKVNFDDMRLRGFNWLEDKRPKSKEDLMK